SSFLTASVSEYSVAVDHEAYAPQASSPPRVATRVKAAPTPVDIPVTKAAGKASTSWPSMVFFGNGDDSVAVCARALLAWPSTNNDATIALAQKARPTVATPIAVSLREWR
ncbi:MAG: hypothetical protein ABSF35_07125, partial [Polyangia bacterium]